MGDYTRALRSLHQLERVFEPVRCAQQSKQWLALTRAYMGGHALSFPYEFRTRTGERICLETFHDLVTAWVVFCRREYDVPSASKTIIDAGANIGTFTVFAAKRAPDARIIAVEPCDDTRRRLEQHVRLNGLAARVAIKPWALAAENGWRKMDARNGPSQSRGLLPLTSHVTSQDVRAITLESMLSTESLECVDLLKMDIEGAEHEVFPATPPAALKPVRAIALEYHPNGSKAHLFESLAAAGYRLVRDVQFLPDSGVAHFVRG